MSIPSSFCSRFTSVMSSSNQHSSKVHTISSGSNGSDRELLLRVFSIRAGRVEEEEANLSNFGEEVGTDEGPAWGGTLLEFDRRWPPPHERRIERGRLFFGLSIRDPVFSVRQTLASRKGFEDLSEGLVGVEEGVARGASSSGGAAVG